MFRPKQTRTHLLRPACCHLCASSKTLLAALFAALLVSSFAPGASGQAVTVNSSGNVVSGTASADAYIDRRFRQVEPTKVDLPREPMDTRARIQLLRVLEAQQGFAMRPIPRGHRGLTLQANGKLEPAGEKYLDMVTNDGICAKPGDRIVITDVKIERSRIILQLNGGPDFKHRFLRHIQIGSGPIMNPVVQDGNQTPQGARVTLTFQGQVPAVDADQVQQLLAPLISFGVKTPVEAFTDTLPTPLKNAILGHQVLVGMTTDMVIFAKGRPEQKYHEMDGQMPVDIWVYGKAPQTVDFVRINGNRVIRVEIAETGKPLQVFETDVVDGMMHASDQPVVAANANTHTIQMGDVQRNPDTQAPAPPPTLRNAGESLPSDDQNGQRLGVMRPVRFPQQKPDDDDAAAARTSQPAAPANPASTPATAPATPATAPAPATPAPQPQQFVSAVVN